MNENIKRARQLCRASALSLTERLEGHMRQDYDAGYEAEFVGMVIADLQFAKKQLIKAYNDHLENL